MTDDLHELGELLVTTAAAVVRRAPSDGMDMSLAAARVLARIRDSGSIRISDLAVQERSSQPTITNHIKRLESAGLVERAVDPSDARAWLIAITPLGLDRLAQLRSTMSSNLKPTLAKLSARDRKALRAGLEVMQRMIATR